MKAHSPPSPFIVVLLFPFFTRGHLNITAELSPNGGHIHSNITLGSLFFPSVLYGPSFLFHFFLPLSLTHSFTPLSSEHTHFALKPRHFSILFPLATLASMQLTLTRMFPKLFFRRYEKLGKSKAAMVNSKHYRGVSQPTR